MKKGKGSKDNLQNTAPEAEETFEAGYLKGFSDAATDKSTVEKKKSGFEMKAVYFALIALLASIIYLHWTSQTQASEGMQRIIEENRVNQELMKKNYEKIIETVRREKDTLRVPGVPIRMQQDDLMSRDGEVEKLLSEIEEFRMDKELHHIEIEKLEKEHGEAVRKGKEIIANQQTALTGKDKKITQLREENEKFAKELLDVTKESDMKNSVITDYYGRIQRLEEMIQNERLDKSNPKTRNVWLRLYEGRFGFAFNKRNCISKIHAGSAAELSKLKVGDQILTMNDVDVSKLSYTDIMGLVEEAKEAGDISLTVRHNPDLLKEPETASKTTKTTKSAVKTSSDSNPTRSIFLQSQGGRFGFVFKGQSITKVHTGSAADFAGVLVGDEIISMDGLPLARLSHEQITNVMRDCQEAGNINLVVRHNPELLRKEEASTKN